MKKICEECGKEYEARRKDQRWCKDPHYRICEVCGKKFLVKSLADNPHTCSAKCRTKLGVDRLSKKYGQDITSVSQLDYVKEKKKISNASAEAQAKSKKTCLDRYGVEYVAKAPEVRKKISERLKSPEVREKVRQTYQERYGVDHLFADEKFREKHGCNTIAGTPEVKERIKHTIRERYGVDHFYEIPGMHERAKETRRITMQERYNADTLFASDIFKQKMIEQYGVENVGQSLEIRSKIGEGKSKYVANDGTRVESSYEKEIYNYCLRNNLEFKYQYMMIPYIYKIDRITTIDFSIDGMLLEAKGPHLLSGVFKAIEVPIECKLQVYQEHDVIIVTDIKGRQILQQSDFKDIKVMDVQDFIDDKPWNDIVGEIKDD